MASADWDGNGKVESIQTEVHGMLNSLAMLLPPKDEPEVTEDVTDTTHTQLEKEAVYNYFFVEDDASSGMHNTKFAVALLQATLDTLGRVTSVNTPIASMPLEFALKQNYPNPFNPTTRIDFALPEGSEVKLVVYNMLGEVVRTLADGYYAAGTHNIEWDARDDYGNMLSGGMYIYRIQTEKNVVSKKMILLK